MTQHIVRRLLQQWWRWSRGLTLGARGIVVDGDGRVLLVRHTYVAGWAFPGGGVEWGETAHAALTRELAEEAGITITGPVDLLGIYSNHAAFPGDHVAVFVVRTWRQHPLQLPTREIAEIGFFPIDDLPRDTPAGTRRRIAELTGTSRPDGTW